MRETLLQLQTELIYAGLVGTMRLSNPALAAIISRINKIALMLTENSEDETLKLLAELETFFTNQTPECEALHRMVLDARPSQLKSVIRGYLVNYVYDW